MAKRKRYGAPPEVHDQRMTADTKRFVQAVKRTRSLINAGDCTEALTELEHAGYLRGRRDAEQENLPRRQANWKLIAGTMVALKRDFRVRCLKPRRK
jgi:hypothetical protein